MTFTAILPDSGFSNGRDTSQRTSAAYTLAAWTSVTHSAIMSPISSASSVSPGGSPSIWL